MIKNSEEKNDRFFCVENWNEIIIPFTYEIRERKICSQNQWLLIQKQKCVANNKSVENCLKCLNKVIIEVNESLEFTQKK